jgi:hypothetical protein
LKKTITISFLLLLLFSQAGYYLIYKLQQHQIKESVKQELLSRLPESSLEIIDANANKNDIEWEEKNKEFYLHGQMYDVAFIKVADGKKLIYCINDNKEEDLLKRFANAVKSVNEQSNSGKDGQHEVKFQLSDFLIPDLQIITISEPVPAKYVDYSSPLINNITELFTPPPDLMLKNKTRFL